MKQILKIMAIVSLMAAVMIGCGTNAMDPIEQVCKEQFVGRTYEEMVKEKGTPDSAFGFDQCAYVNEENVPEYIINVFMQHEDGKDQKKSIIYESIFNTRSIEFDIVEKYIYEITKRCGEANDEKYGDVAGEMMHTWKSKNERYSIVVLVLTGRYDETKYDVEITLTYEM